MLPLFFKNYFGAQFEHYRDLNLNVTQLKASSYSVLETIAEIDGIIQELEKKNQKALFIGHSLGGLALLDYLIANEKTDVVKGVIFLQSPFYGSPVASVYFKNPYYARTMLGPIMHFVNTSEESVRYLTLEQRQKLMATNSQRISDIIQRIPMLTAGGTSLNYKSLMRPSMNIIGRGCPVYTLGKCRSRILYDGPYDDSDGMVPFKNSQLPGVDFVELEGVDHGETVLAMPYKNINRVKMTDSLMKLLLLRIN